jgi:hypothetical protein
MLIGAVGVLLLIACVNVASLFLARGAARDTELMVRAALGCSGWRLVRQLLLESMLLAITGAIAGLVLSRIIAATLLAAAPQVVARAGSAGLERTVFLFSLGVAVLAGIGFGVAPALQATRPDLEAVLRESGRSGSSSRRHARARNVLVVCQMAWRSCCSPAPVCCCAASIGCGRSRSASARPTSSHSKCICRSVATKIRPGARDFTATFRPGLARARVCERPPPSHDCR